MISTSFYNDFLPLPKNQDFKSILLFLHMYYEQWLLEGIKVNLSKTFIMLEVLRKL